VCVFGGRSGAWVGRRERGRDAFCQDVAEVVFVFVAAALL